MRAFFNRTRDRLIKYQLKRKRQLHWWLVYGPARTGTTFMWRLILECSRLGVSDWGLVTLLNHFSTAPHYEQSRFDKARALEDISRNILDGAVKGSGSELDLVYKQSHLESGEYDTLRRMWGEPGRIIFCLRDPAGYMASAAKKYPEFSNAHLQERYMSQLLEYSKIGGDIFEYMQKLRLENYTSFLQPLNVADSERKFTFKGNYDHENATQDMWVAFHDLQRTETPVCST